jgi:hypothetical protein
VIQTKFKTKEFEAKLNLKGRRRMFGTVMRDELVNHFRAEIPHRSGGMQKATEGAIVRDSGASLLGGSGIIVRITNKHPGIRALTRGAFIEPKKKGRRALKLHDGRFARFTRLPALGFWERAERTTPLALQRAWNRVMK